MLGGTDLFEKIKFLSSFNATIIIEDCHKNVSNLSDVVVCLLRVRHIASQRARNNLILTHYVGGACSDRTLLIARRGVHSRV